ncbi:MBL fold metallo-hydrolase [Crystallibacter degradans]|uniref:MBL fold metallo-hydrolase n=1 Tax=Crystallibacter degradans TaxID=2726743 RepID=UPI0014729B58|nr:MBL fold metallo-hydrolase [Arthrobacter sp. SF27]NMR28869.1 MBL fold metallo-hydrolase [Arthrobacter sp. SF27]
MNKLALTHIGGPTAFFKLGGWTFLTDPTFDPPQEYPTPAGTLVKTSGPAVELADLPGVDVVLLSHDEHADNLDNSGRKLVESGGCTVFGTPEAAGRIPAVTGMSAWEETTLQAAGKQDLTITAVPALHGPEGCEPVTGTVTGFVLSGADLPTVYVSGDNASVAVVGTIAERFAPVDVAVLFTGAARIGIFDNAPLTLTAGAAAEAAAKLQTPAVVPVHAEGWTHFSEGHKELRTEFAGKGLGDSLRIPTPGQELVL